LTAEKTKAYIPAEFKLVMLSQATGWSYWEMVSQPLWFMDRLEIYMQAKQMADKINETKQRGYIPKSPRTSPRRFKG